ncbi:MAG: YegS/Rv2252/BmrU family lipid kinase [Clostridia bacterium]|nr:YegS/Rv2252/BmrU family lipid kinase [Clostridia bacterium]
MTHHLFIVNPAAGKADRSEAIEKAVNNAKEQGAVEGEVSLYRTAGPGDATEYLINFLRETKDDVRVYACGGDGTLNEVVKGIYASGKENVALGVVPTGSGNDFIRSFAIPESSFRSVRDMMKGKVTPIDLIRVTSEDGVEYVCINVASAGFDAAVCRKMQSFRRLPMMGGSVAYNMALVRQFLGHLGHKFQVFGDGKPMKTPNKDEYLFTVVANGKYYGGGYCCSPKSSLSDGLLNLVMIESIPRTQFPGLLGPYRKGEYFEKLEGRMLHKTVKTVEFRGEEPLDMNLDGEIIAIKNPVLDVIHHAVGLILPG